MHRRRKSGRRVGASSGKLAWRQLESLESRCFLTRPVAVPDFYEVLEDTQLTISRADGVLANDRDADGDELTALVETDAVGEWQLNPDGSFTYTPPPDFHGRELAGYKASDGTESSFEGLVQINVLPVNDLPESNSDRYLTLVDEALRVPADNGVLANDTDADGDTIRAQLLTSTSHGQIELMPDGSFLYSPDSNFEGQDTFTYSAADAEGNGNTVTVTIDVVAQPVVINEFMAANGSTLETRTREDANARFRGDTMTSDWIELANLHSQPIDLSGMHLTDDVNDPTKWAFPAGTSIPANGFLVVFASGENLLDPELDENGFLHTNFQLKSDGEYLALTTPNGTPLFEANYPRQVTDVSYGVAASDIVGGFAYFIDPSPGSANSAPKSGFVEDTQFSVDRGFFAEPFQLEITSSTANSTIWYTLDGSVPTDTNGFTYSAPITIARTTSVRAMAMHEDLVPTNVDTQTYFFLDDVVEQSDTPPDAFPATWGRTFTDWGMDQDPADLAAIAGDESLTVQQAHNVIKDSLLALPTMSLVGSVDGFFGCENGIYANTEGRGEQWERPVSVEYIDPSGNESDFQIDAGIRIQGFTSRNPARNPKHSLRLIFRDRYGDARLNYPLFGPNAAESFDTLVLRSNSQDAWVYATADNRQAQFIRDQWARETLLAMGQVQPHGNWVHLYINGLYWGLYNPTERPDATFNASYLGGGAADYDILKNHEEFIDGNRDAYDELLAAIQNNPRQFSSGYRDLSDPAAYQRILGNNPDGTRNPDYSVLVNVSGLIDYIIVGAYAAANDWPGNFYMGRDRSENSTGFHFFMWDNEHGMKPSARVNRTVPHSRDADSPTKFYHALRQNDEFRLQFADHLHRAFFNGGVLYVDPDEPDWNPSKPGANMPAARWMELTGQIEQALIAEAARWGDVRGTQYTPHDQFQALRDRLLRTWFPSRSQTVFEQFKRLGLYPDHAAPVFSQHGGRIRHGDQILIENPNNAGQIFYSLDGTDPRVQGLAYTTPVTISGNATLKSRVFLDGKWSALNEANFTTAVPADSSNLRISEINYNPSAPTELEQAAGFDDNDEFEFIEFVNVSNEAIDLSSVTIQQIDVAGELQGVSFDFAESPISTLPPGSTVLVVENQAAFEMRYGADIFVAGQWQGKLSNAGETLTVYTGESVVQQFAYSDDWYVATDGNGKTLELVTPAATDLDRWSEASAWRPSVANGGSPGTVLWQIPGDANGDGKFDSEDLVLVFTAGEYEDGIAGNSTFEEGDWNGDGDFTSSDLVFAFMTQPYIGALKRGDSASALGILV
ncbi:MAG: tandem-95 repeat protein [Planctomycetales bacterium]|nr:tandem-95 repeat protein [Planctomycetales bacterium]